MGCTKGLAKDCTIGWVVMGFIMGLASVAQVSAMAGMRLFPNQKTVEPSHPHSLFKTLTAIRVHGT